jgi:hypothetical protein
MHTPLHRANTGSWLYTNIPVAKKTRVHELFKNFAFKILSHSARIVRCFLPEYGDSKCRISSRMCTPITNKDTDAQETNMGSNVVSYSFLRGDYSFLKTIRRQR